MRPNKTKSRHPERCCKGGGRRGGGGGGSGGGTRPKVSIQKSNGAIDVSSFDDQTLSIGGQKITVPSNEGVRLNSIVSDAEQRVYVAKFINSGRFSSEIGDRQIEVLRRTKTAVPRSYQLIANDNDPVLTTLEQQGRIQLTPLEAGRRRIDLL